ncbi:MAG: hypothetical protein AAF433_23170 [Bacteroidota bacterium]
MINVYLRLDTSRKLKNGSHPIVLMVTWGNNVRRKRLKNFSCKKQSWDFDRHRFLHSERKNDLLDAYEKKARRIADYMDEWDYNHFVKELNRSEEKKEPTQKKLFAYLKEIENYYFENDQVSYSNDFKWLQSFLSKCFKRDMRLQDFRKKELQLVLREMDERHQRLELSQNAQNGPL